MGLSLGDFWRPPARQNWLPAGLKQRLGRLAGMTLFTFQSVQSTSRTLLLQRWPHGPSLHLKPAHRQDVEATVYPRPSQKESAKKSAGKAGESARGTGFDAERRLGGVGQGNVIRLAESGRRRPISTPCVHPTLWAAGTVVTILQTRRRRSLSA